MQSAKTIQLGVKAADLKRAAGLLTEGRLVAFPTETVYGLGADATNGTAVASIYAVKGRPSFNPLIVHVSDVATARKYVGWSVLADQLADAFWPGPLTLVLPLNPDTGLSSLVTAGLETLAIRVPAHPVAQKVLAEFGGPVAAPSANPSGRISPTTAQHVAMYLDGKLAAIVDGGPCGVGVESTIVGINKAATLLRPGGVPQTAIEAMIDAKLAVPSVHASVTAPGQLTSHYAPHAGVRLNATTARTGEALLGFGAMQSDFNLSYAGDLTEAAARLFDGLHILDAMDRPIAVAPIPETGLGVAINDRLRRAAAPRPDASGVPSAG